MWKKIALTTLTLLLLAGTVAIIGWIGFQEHFRLLARSFQKELMTQKEQMLTQEEKQKEMDHTVIETKGEAKILIDALESRLRSLESDNLPED